MISNSVKLIIAKKRWFKKIFKNFLPEKAYRDFGGFKVFFSLKDIAGPSFDLSYGGASSFEKYEEIDKKLIKSFLKDGDVFFDIGANIGHFSFYFKQIFKNLHCHLFEPHPVLNSCLSDTIDSSNMTNLFVHKVALSNENSTLDFFEDTFNDGGHSLILDKLSSRSNKGHSFKVKAVTLDEYLININLISLDFMKIDVQGAEFLLLEGGVSTIKRFRPLIFVELDNTQVLAFWNRIEELTGIKFKLISPHSGPSKSLTKEEISDFAQSFIKDGVVECNWLLIPTP